MNELLTLIQTRCPNTELYVQSILPFNNEVRLWKGLQGCEAVVPEANAKIKKLCQEKNIPFIDIYSLMVDEKGNLKKEYTNDGLHLMGPAYLIWRDALLPYVNK